MSDFVSDFWGYFVAGITLVSIIACGVLLWVNGRARVASVAPSGDGGANGVGTTGHVWDGDLAEYNNPLPRWWMWLFYITIVFSLAYLVLYPGFGRAPGVLGWTSSGAYVEEQKEVDARLQPLYARYLAMDLKTVAADPAAHAMGERLFLTYCAQCHGSDARGGRGFPNLTDTDWLYGGDPAAIQATITSGRAGIMPPLGAALGEDGIRNVANYVLSLSGLEHDAALAGNGKETFVTICAACHGAEGKGNPALGAPNLTDRVWLYGSSLTTISETIRNGRTNKMPAWGEFLGDAKTHLLTAYVWGLSHAK
ncbi:MAG: cytochrome-c oxidase, cbb3-type subunit III [Burkholderiales bacterium]